jgi:non-ribosomal peptide synthetase component E (peptide arylation enzyme)
MIEEYTNKGYWTSTTFADLWDRNANDYPEKEAIVDSKTRLTWAQAKQWIDRIALGFLERGIGRDEVMVIQLPPCVELGLLFIACEKAGIVCFPALRTLRHKEIEYILKYVEATSIVIPWKLKDFDYFQMVEEIRPNLPLLRHIFVIGNEVPKGTASIKQMVQQPLEGKYPSDYLEERSFNAREISLIRQTTGTTGLPKFPQSPTCVRIYAGKIIAEDFKLTADDIGLVLSPTIGGPNSANFFAAPQVGAKIIMMEHFDAEEALKLIEREKVTYIPAVPTMLERMVKHPNFNNYDLSAVRLVIATGAILPYQLGTLVEEKIGCPVVQLYGSAESGGITRHIPDDPQEVRLLTVGKSPQGTEMKLVNEEGEEVTKGEIGEVWGRGPSFTLGFYEDPEHTWEVWTKDGWFRTGDMGKFDEQGNLVIAGRKKEVIIRGGQNIYPREIEDILVTHPKVRDVAVIGMPDPLMGEKACAFVVTKGKKGFTFDEMITYLKDKKIALYKFPERLEIMDELPLAGEAKVNKKKLQEIIIQKLNI